mgnify:CR=1 FL=1
MIKDDSMNKNDYINVYLTTDTGIKNVFDSWEIFVKVELGLPLDNLPTQANHYCGIVLFHPGAGTVNSISKPNKDDYPSLVKTSIKVKAGDQIAPRQGVGEDVGYCILSAKAILPSRWHNHRL